MVFEAIKDLDIGNRMRIGYPCINRSIGCTSNSTFRLASYSEENLVSKISNNLECLDRILKYNIGAGLLFFRISSDIVPFASHPVCKYNWGEHFKREFRSMGKLIKRNRMRISMHPDQFVLLNSPRREVTERSISELEYHCKVLNLMGLGSDAKIQIHVGGVYGEKEKAIERFLDRYVGLSKLIRNRLVIENDERLFPLRDCLRISGKCGIPVVFDSFHHRCLNNGETARDGMESSGNTWKKKDGVLMVDYSSQKKGGRRGQHVESIDLKDFRGFIERTGRIEFDLMLEIKDKEKSALMALGAAKHLTKGI